MGHLLALGKLFYLGEILLFSDNYFYYVIVNLVLHALVVTQLYRMLRVLGTNPDNASIVTLMYGLYFAHVDNLRWGMQCMLLLATLAMIASSISALTYMRYGHGRALLASTLLNLAAAFTFGLGLVAGILTILCCVCDDPINRRRLFKVAAMQFVATTLAVACYLAASTAADQSSNHPTAAIASPLETLIPEAILNRAFYSFLAKGVVGTIADFLLVANAPGDRIVFYGIVILIGMGFGSVFTPGKVPLVKMARYGFVYLLANCTLLVLPAISRWPFGDHAALAMRYQHFALIPSILLIGGTLSVCVKNRKVLLLACATVWMVHETTNLTKLNNVLSAQNEMYQGFARNYTNYRFSTDVLNESAGNALFDAKVNPALTNDELRCIINVLFLRRSVHGSASPCMGTI